MPLDGGDALVAVGMLMYMSLAVSALYLFDTDEDGIERDQINHQLIADCLETVRRIKRKHQRWQAELDQPPKKKAKYDYERARTCIYQDYLGPDPLFGKYFERVFRVSRGITESLIQICGSTHSFFTASFNKVTGEPCIYPEAKVLMALKLLGYSVAPTGFMDYFQMSDQTGRKCLKIFCRVIANHPSLRQNYLRGMTKSDAMRE
jgi:hypothetical protein